MTTRIRAVAITTLTSLLFVLNVLAEPVRSKLLEAALIGLVLTLGTFWVLFFKRRGNSVFAVVLFPAMAIMPYVLFADTIIQSLFSALTKVPSTILAGIIFWILCYLLILTANVLNGALLYKIPLGQAGKAAQFIFSLISSYLLIAFLFGSAFPIHVRVAVVVLFTFYYAYSGIWNLQVVHRQVLLSASAISIVMGLLVAVLSVWPIASIYATVISVVFLYILLNVALEMREHIGRAIWIEYAVLFVISLLILLTIAEWGINGTVL